MAKRRELETKKMYDYEMYFEGKLQTLPLVILTKSPFDNQWMMSAAEYERITDLYGKKEAK